MAPRICLLPCECDDGTCRKCQAILALEQYIEATSIVIRNKNGDVVLMMTKHDYEVFQRLQNSE